MSGSGAGESPSHSFGRRFTTSMRARVPSSTRPLPSQRSRSRSDPRLAADDSSQGQQHNGHCRHCIAERLSPSQIQAAVTAPLIGPGHAEYHHHNAAKGDGAQDQISFLPDSLPSPAGLQGAT